MILVMGLGAVAQGGEEPAKLIEQGEALLSKGSEVDRNRGVILLNRALSIEPANEKALDDLGTAAQAWPDYAATLFERLEKARAGHPSAEIDRKLIWWQLSYAVYFGKSKVIDELLAEPDKIILGDAQRRAALGALLVELGRARQGDALLSAAGDLPLAQYYRAIFAARRGNVTSARETLNKMQGDGSVDLLRNIGLATVDLSAPGGVEKAKQLLANAERTGVKLPPLFSSECRLLSIRVALAEHRRQDAAIAAQLMTASPYRCAPSAMVQASALLGPLHKVLASGLH